MDTLYHMDDQFRSRSANKSVASDQGVCCSFLGGKTLMNLKANRIDPDNSGKHDGADLDLHGRIGIKAISHGVISLN